MPRLAIAICILWFVSLFVFRSVHQWRTTGSTGIKGFHGPVGSSAWLAGLAASVGLVFAPLAPIAALYAWPGGLLWVSADWLHLLGGAIAIIGIAGALMAQLSMGESWRIGVDEDEETRLVTGGLFAWVRNPIFTFIGLSIVGLVLLVPNVLAGLTAIFFALGIELQVRAVEEPYLVKTHGAAYREFASRVGRFVPGIGRLTPDRG